MPNSIHPTDIEIDDSSDVEEVSKNDFAFIIGPDGELKTLMIPETFDIIIPDEVKMILEFYGIDDIENLANRTLH
jgi:hypothetical protein